MRIRKTFTSGINIGLGKDASSAVSQSTRPEKSKKNDEAAISTNLSQKQLNGFIQVTPTLEMEEPPDSAEIRHKMSQKSRRETAQDY